MDTPRLRLGLALGAGIVLALAAGQARAAGGPVWVRTAGEPTVRAEAGEVVATVFELRARGSVGGDHRGRLVLPEGWLTVAAEAPFRLEPGRPLRRPASEPAESVRLALSWAAARRLSWSFTGSHERNRFALDGESREVGAGLHFAGDGGLSVDLEGHWSTSRGAERTFGLLRLERTLARGRRAALEAQYLSDDELVVALVYSLPLRLPLGAGPDAGTVRGRVHDARGEGVAGVLVAIGGQEVATDTGGEFRLAGVAAGEWILRLDLRGLAVGHVADVPTPLRVLVEEGETARVEVPVVASARVGGEIVVHRRGPVGGPSPAAATRGGATAPEPGSPLRGVLVTLRRPGETVHRLTEADGRFHAVGLRPGRWKVEVDDAGLPPHHRAELPAGGWLELAPGAEVDVEVRVVPVERRLRMQSLPGGGRLELDR